MCYGQVVVSILFLLINTYYTGKLINVGFLVQMRDLLPTILYTSVMGVAIWGLVFLIPSSVGQIVVGVLIGIPLYMLLSRLARSQEYKYLIDLMQRYIPVKYRGMVKRIF